MRRNEDSFFNQGKTLNSWTTFIPQSSRHSMSIFFVSLDHSCHLSVIPHSKVIPIEINLKTTKQKWGPNNLIRFRPHLTFISAHSNLFPREEFRSKWNDFGMIEKWGPYRRKHWIKSFRPHFTLISAHSILIMRVKQTNKQCHCHCQTNKQCQCHCKTNKQC